MTREDKDKDRMLKRPNMWYIFGKQGVEGCQLTGQLFLGQKQTRPAQTVTRPNLQRRGPHFRSCILFNTQGRLVKDTTCVKKIAADRSLNDRRIGWGLMNSRWIQMDWWIVDGCHPPSLPVCLNWALRNMEFYWAEPSFMKDSLFSLAKSVLVFFFKLRCLQIADRIMICADVTHHFFFATNHVNEGSQIPFPMTKWVGGDWLKSSMREAGKIGFSLGPVISRGSKGDHQ